jgi:glutaminase
MMLVIPNVMGISLWSPRLDNANLNNSARGVEFCKELIQLYHFHRSAAMMIFFYYKP